MQMHPRRALFELASFMLVWFTGVQVFAQDPASIAPPAEFSSTPELVLPAGQQISFAFRSGLSSQKSKLGDIIEIVVVRDVKIEELTVIAAGSIGRGKVIAVKRRGHKGRPGDLRIEFDEVRSVDGLPVSLRGEHKASGEDRSEQVRNDAASVVIEGLGFGAILIPAVLLERGGSAEIEPGMQFDAAVANDLLLERASIAQHQPKQSPDKATIFIVYANYLTCGSVLLIPPNITSNVTRMELPEGKYWFHSGMSSNTVRDISAGFLLGLTFGAVDAFGFPSVKKMLNRPVDEFFSLEVKGGQTYYLTGLFPGDSRVKSHLKAVAADDAEAALEVKRNRFFFWHDLPKQIVDSLQAPPRAIQNATR